MNTISFSFLERKSFIGNDQRSLLFFHFKVILFPKTSLLSCQPLAGKESTCSAGNSGSIPGWVRFPGEGIGYPLKYSWASLVAQLVKNPPAIQETWVRSPGWKDPLEKGYDYPLQYSGLENSIDCIVHGVAESDATKWLSFSFSSRRPASQSKSRQCFQKPPPRWFQN